MAGELTAIIAVLTFVISNVIFRKTEHDSSPTYINFFRTGIGTLTFILMGLFLNLFIKVFLIPWEIWMLLIISFVFGQVIADTAYFKAQKELGTTIALAVSMTFPIFTFILSIVFLNQTFDVMVIFSITLIGIGIIIIGRSKMYSEDTKIINAPSGSKSVQTHKAIAFGLVASLGWAIALVMIDYGTNQIDQILQEDQSISSIIGNLIRFPFASLMLATMVWSENNILKKREKISVQKRTSNSYFILILGAIIGTSIGAYVYTEAARVAGATIMALMASASPLFALPLTYLVNKEKITKFGFLGVILTIMGVILILI